MPDSTLGSVSTDPHYRLDLTGQEAEHLNKNYSIETETLLDTTQLLRTPVNTEAAFELLLVRLRRGLVRGWIGAGIARMIITNVTRAAEDGYLGDTTFDTLLILGDLERSAAPTSRPKPTESVADTTGRHSL